MNDPPLSRAERDHKKRKEAAAHVAAIRATEAAQKDVARQCAAWLADQRALEPDVDLFRAIGRLLERYRLWAWRTFGADIEARPALRERQPIGPAARSLSATRSAT